MAGGWEVLDTAVKVGLGAALTGVASWSTTRLTLRRQESRERLAKRVADFERVVEAVEGTREASQAFLELLGDWVANREEPDLQAELEKPLSARKEGLEAALLGLERAHTRLLLLGESPCAEALEAFRTAVDDCFREAWNQRDVLDEAGLRGLQEPVGRARSTLLCEMRTIYRNLAS